MRTWMVGVVLLAPRIVLASGSIPDSIPYYEHCAVHDSKAWCVLERVDDGLENVVSLYATEETFFEVFGHLPWDLPNVGVDVSFVDDIGYDNMRNNFFSDVLGGAFYDIRGTRDLPQLEITAWGALANDFGQGTFTVQTDAIGNIATVQDPTGRFIDSRLMADNSDSRCTAGIMGGFLTGAATGAIGGGKVAGLWGAVAGASVLSVAGALGGYAKYCGQKKESNPTTRPHQTGSEPPQKDDKDSKKLPETIEVDTNSDDGSDSSSSDSGNNSNNSENGDVDNTQGDGSSDHVAGTPPDTNTATPNPEEAESTDEGEVLFGWVSGRSRLRIPNAGVEGLINPSRQVSKSTVKVVKPYVDPLAPEVIHIDPPTIYPIPEIPVGGGIKAPVTPPDIW